VTAPLSGDLLCQAVERPMVILRALGSSEMIRVENRMTFFASGNNLSFADDMTRRGLICQMDANLERPETRQFSFNPLHRVLANRERYVKACLTVCRAYIVAGKPDRRPPLLFATRSGPALRADSPPSGWSLWPKKGR
jgi:putative DNA primase/helicase